MELWGLVEMDLHEVFGIDLGDRELLCKRTWPWLQRRAYAVAFTPGTRAQRVLRPDLTPRYQLPQPKTGGLGREQ